MDLNRIREIIDKINQVKSENGFNSFGDERADLLTLDLLTSIFEKNINEGILSEIFNACLCSRNDYKRGFI